jgi:predicted DNA-binding protein
MKDVLSVRLNETVMRRIRALSKDQKRGGSAVARDLIECGWTYMKLREYRQG